MSIILLGDKQLIGSALYPTLFWVLFCLCFPTKNAVATSTLSKRWEFLWRIIHNLDFCFEDEGRTVDQDEDESKKFVEFVNHVLLHRDAGVLNKFRLVWTRNCIESHATSWIKTAITRNVHELSITLESFDEPIDMMPISVFSCDSLRSLHLRGWICLSAPTVFCLPRLESLDLDRVTFESDETFEKMIRACPVLKNLHIDIPEDVDEFRFIISSTSLRRLELDLGYHKYLQLEASSLEHLKLYGFNISVNFLQNKLTCLVKANFGIDLNYENFSQASVCNSVVDAVSALDCAKILTLSSRVMGFQEHPCDGSDHDHSNWTAPIEVPRCLSNSLKKVVLNGYYGYKDEREMIRYILKHGIVLEVMQISSLGPVDDNGMVKEICEFTRKSPICEVKFSSKHN